MAPLSGTPGANPRQPGSDAPCGLLQAVDFFSAGASCSGVLTVDGSEGAPFDVADQAGRIVDDRRVTGRRDTV